MLFEVPVRYSSGVAILKAPPSMTIGSGCEVIRSAAAAQCDAGHHFVLLDCAETVRVDSLGLGEMVAAYSGVTRRGGALKLLHVSERVAKLLSIARLDHLLEAYPDEQSAIASFRTSANANARAALDQFLE